jgi:putative phosphoesterase
MYAARLPDLIFGTDQPMRIAVLADTHIPNRAKTLPKAAWDLVKEADTIIHAGDVVNREFLRELQSIAPLYAVRGNNDLQLTDLPETLEIELSDVSVAIIHDSGDKKGRSQRMRKRFPHAEIVVFGHSHIPINEQESGLLLFNPGSPTDRRMQPVCTMGLLDLHNGSIRAEIVSLR